MKLRWFNSVKMCPACGWSVSGFRVKYSSVEQLDAGDGQFVSVGTIGAAPVPHLEKHCPKCDFGWLEEIASPEPTA